jgi:hypothetical protein
VQLDDNVFAVVFAVREAHELAVKSRHRLPPSSGAMAWIQMSCARSEPEDL